MRATDSAEAGDKAHFQVLGFRDVVGRLHHAFQPLSVGGDQRRVFRRVANIAQMLL